MTSIGRSRAHVLHPCAGILHMLVLCGGLVASLPACGTTEEAIKKSKGYYQEGVANLSTDRQLAYVSFQKAVQLNPDNTEAHYGLGHIYVMRGKLKEAEQEFREAIRIDPDYSEAHTYLGQVFAGQDRWDHAVEQYRKALSNPLYATPDLARYHLGRALLQQGDARGAMEALEDALTVNPPSVPPAMVHLELGRTYHKLGFNARAREALTKVSSLDQGGSLATEAEDLLRRIAP